MAVCGAIRLDSRCHDGAMLHSLEALAGSFVFFEAGPRIIVLGFGIIFEVLGKPAEVVATACDTMVA